MPSHIPKRVHRGRPRMYRPILVAAILSVAGTLHLPASAPAIEPGEPFTGSFPRLGLMWPDPSTQPVGEIAKFDYVALHPHDTSAVPALRAANPDIIVLTSSNACELTIDVSDTPDATRNWWISQVPNEWIQTQLGSYLLEPVAAADQILKVETPSRFRNGDILVIEDELATVAAVGTSDITVVRGRLPERSPAAAHPAGTRVAPAAVFWPGSVVMDLSDYCPRVTVDSAVGPETWAEYNARVASRLLSRDGVDGIFIDRTNANAYVNQVFTRSIDPSRTNTPVADNYTALNAAWNSGLRTYLSLVRASAGGKVVLANNGAPNYDLLNGTVLENVPKSAPAYGLGHWWSVVYGPDGRSYTNFMRSSQQPNLTTLETYEVEQSPIQGTTPLNPALAPGWNPNYQKMRFGLCTTLMNDGFFNYNIGTFGHASLGLLWFDEYDNAGKGVGYLGRPTDAARLALAALTSADLVRGDGSFSNSSHMSRWETFRANGYSVSKALNNGTAKITVTRSRGDLFGAFFRHRDVPVNKGALYTVTFRAKASRPLGMLVGVWKVSSPWTNYLPFSLVTLGTNWQTYTLVTESKGTDSSAALSFAVGQETGTIWLDDVRIQKGWRPNTYRRDFENGVALVNPELKSVRVPLGGVYKKLTGTQDPAVNTGLYVSAVTLGAQDGIVLLRTSRLSISRTKTITYPAATAISGTLKTPAGSTIGNGRIVLYSSKDKSSWSQAGQTMTTATGSYSFTVKPSRNTYYKTRYFGGGDNLDGFSSVTAVYVNP